MDQDYVAEKEWRGFVAGLLWGAALGAIGAALMLPEAGEKTRKKLKELIAEVQHQGTDATEKIAEVVSSWVEKISAASGGEQGIRKALDALKQELKELESAPEITGKGE